MAETPGTDAPQPKNADEPASWTRWIGPGAFFLAFGLFLVFLVTLERPKVLISADLQTEALTVRVKNPDHMTLDLPAALVGADECQRHVRVRPSQDAIIYFTRNLDGDLFVAIEGAASWTSDGSTAPTSDKDALFRISSREESCAYAGRLRLPVVGELAAGTTAAGEVAPEEFRPLTSGRLRVYGRAVERMFGFIPLSALAAVAPFEPGKLFDAGEFEVPPGSELEGGSARFFGYAESVFGEGETGEGGIRVLASSNATELFVFAPAPRTSGAASVSGPASLAAYTISMTFGTRLAQDPNLHLLFAGFSFMAVLGGIADRFLEFVRGAQRKKSPDAR